MGKNCSMWLIETVLSTKKRPNDCFINYSKVHHPPSCSFRCIVGNEPIFNSDGIITQSNSSSNCIIIYTNLHSTPSYPFQAHNLFMTRISAIAICLSRMSCVHTSEWFVSSTLGCLYGCRGEKNHHKRSSTFLLKVCNPPLNTLLTPSLTLTHLVRTVVPHPL